jgi:hypothetical protein
MPRSDLERLAESMRVLAGQVERDVPSLQERQRHIAQLAARAARLAGPSDPGLTRVAQLARLAAERLADAIEHLVTTARSGHEYAGNLAGRTGGADTASAAPAPDPPGQPSAAAGSAAGEGEAAGGPAQPRRRSTARKFEEARRLLMAEAEDLGDMASHVIEPVLGPPPEAATDGVHDPVSAVVVVFTLGWESAVQLLQRMRRRSRG